MSDAFQSLRRQTREIDDLLRDARQSEWSNVPLDGPVQAPRSLEDEVKVSRWALVEYFLSSFVEWNGLCDRYLRYFGQPPEVVPARMRNLRYECDQFRQRLLFQPAYEGMPEILGREWLDSHEEENIDLDSTKTAEELYHELVEFDLQCRMASIHGWQSIGPWDHFNAISHPAGPNLGWQNLAEDLRGHRQHHIARFDDADDATKDDVRQFVRNYRHATLRASWLEHDRNGGMGVLFAIDRPSADGHAMIEHLLHDLNNRDIPEQESQIAARVLKRIFQAVSEIGYEKFVGDVTATDFLGGDESPLGSSAINLIPGRGPAKCCPMLVAVSRGASRRAKLGFPAIMQKVKIHLTECSEITRTVIVLCDTWDARAFANDHFEELRAHYRKDVRFVFLMIGAPDTAISAVEVKF